MARRLVAAGEAGLVLDAVPVAIDAILQGIKYWKKWIYQTRDSECSIEEVK